MAAYPITGTLQYAIGGISVTGRNLTSGGTETVVTASDGSYTIEPDNMGTYADGDIIRISSGSWYMDVAIDLTNYPLGKVANLSKHIIISVRRDIGLSTPRGISCGMR